MPVAHLRSGTRGLPPPKRCVFTCSGIKGSSTAHNSSDTSKAAVVGFVLATGRVRFGFLLTSLLALLIHVVYQIRVFRIGSYRHSAYRPPLFFTAALRKA